MQNRLYIILVVCAYVFIGNVAFSQSNDIQSIRSRAYNGDAQAMIELSQYYQINGKKDLAEKWLKKAEQTSPGSTSKAKEDFAVENELRQADEMLTKNPMEALKVYLKYYDSNNVHALVGIGYLYDSGIAVGKDKAEAENHYKQAIAIDRKQAFQHMNPEGPLALELLEQEANNDNDILMKVARHYLTMFKDSHSLVSDSNGRNFRHEYTDYKSCKKAIELFQKATEAGNTEAQQYIDELNSIVGQENIKERERKSYSNAYRETMRNFAGIWTSRASYTQYKFDSNGNGWFRNGSGRTWEALGVTYKSYNCIKVYDAHATHTLVISGSKMTQDNSYVYYKQ